MRKLRIAHYCPEPSGRGMDRLAIDLASALQASGHENCIISPSHELLGRLSSMGVKHIPVYRGSSWNFFRRIRRARRLFMGENKIDIFQCYHVEHAWRVFLPYYFTAKKEGTKLVAVHSRYLPTKKLPRSLRHYHASTACSQALREYIQGEGRCCQRQPFWHIPYGMLERECTPSYRPQEQWLRQWESNQPQTRGRFVVTVPCNISPIHGLEDLIPIVQGLKERRIPIHVLLTGETRDADPLYVTQLRQSYLNQGIAEHVTWLGSRQDLRDVLSVSDAALSLARYPSTHNRAVLEALCLGKPVLGYDHGSVGEMLQSFLPEGRLTLGDTEAAVNVLSAWYHRRPECVREIPYPYRFQDTVQNYLQLYEQILSAE